MTPIDDAHFNLILKINQANSSAQFEINDDRDYGIVNASFGTYENEQHPDKPCISLLGYTNHEINFFFDTKCKETLQNLVAQMNKKGLNLKIKEESSIYNPYPDQGVNLKVHEDHKQGMVNSIDGQNRQPLVDFIHAIDAIYPLGHHKADILGLLAWRTMEFIPDNEGEFLDQFIALIHNNQLDAVIGKANKFSNEDLFWHLAEYCSKLHDRQSEAVSLYQQIPKKNRHYQESNLKIAQILMKLDTEPFTIHEKRELKEATFKFLMRSNDQTLIDKSYNELCCTTNLHNIKEDKKTLLSLARELNQKNVQLQKANKTNHSPVLFKNVNSTIPTKKFSKSQPIMRFK